MQNVTITITQGGTTIATLTTNDSGLAYTTLNAGVYTLTFTYPNRLPASIEITISTENTYMIFAFPNYTQNYGSISTSPYFLQTVGFMEGSTEYEFTLSEPDLHSADTSDMFDNSAP